MEINVNSLVDELKNLRVVEKLHEAENKRFGDISQEEISEYLNELRKSGVTNMFGAGAYIEKEFGIAKEDAKKALSYWMKNFKKDESKVKRPKKIVCPECDGYGDGPEGRDPCDTCKGEGTIKESKVNESDFDVQLKKYKQEAYDYYSKLNLSPTPEEILNYVCDCVEDASGADVDDATARMYAKKLGLTLDEHCGHCAEDMKKAKKPLKKIVKKSK